LGHHHIGFKVEINSRKTTEKKIDPYFKEEVSKENFKNYIQVNENKNISKCMGGNLSSADMKIYSTKCFP
jgi:hypothetical protein